MTTSTLSEVLKQMVDALDYVGYAYVTCEEQAQADAAKQAGLDAIVELESQEPVVKLQEPTVERAWFTIAELNAWADKKLSENPHWVMPKEEPERDEPPPQRTWVGLTDMERQMTINKHEGVAWETAIAIEQQLKGKNV